MLDTVEMHCNSRRNAEFSVITPRTLLTTLESRPGSTVAVLRTPCDQVRMVSSFTRSMYGMPFRFYVAIGRHGEKLRKREGW